MAWRQELVRVRVCARSRRTKLAGALCVRAAKTGASQLHIDAGCIKVAHN
jgi:hypothetical protein